MSSLNTFVKAKFTRDGEIEVVESFNAQTDTPVSALERFSAGEEVEFDVFGETDLTWDIQFGDGSCVFSVPKDMFEVVAE